jgi:hypothetical protein
MNRFKMGNYLIGNTSHNNNNSSSNNHSTSYYQSFQKQQIQNIDNKT